MSPLHQNNRTHHGSCTTIMSTPHGSCSTLYMSPLHQNNRTHHGSCTTIMSTPHGFCTTIHEFILWFLLRNTRVHSPQHQTKRAPHGFALASQYLSTPHSSCTTINEHTPLSTKPREHLIDLHNNTVPKDTLCAHLVAHNTWVHLMAPAPRNMSAPHGSCTTTLYMSTT